MKNKLIRSIRTEKILVTFLLVILISSLSVGFAIYQSNLSVSSDVTFLGVTDHNGVLNMTSFNCTDTNNAVGQGYGFNRNETETGVNVVANLRAQFTGSDPYVLFEAEFYNDTNNYYTYDGFDGGIWFSGITSNTPKVLNKARGDYIKPGEKFTLLLTYYYDGDIPYSTESWTSATFKFLTGKQSVSRGTFIATLSTKKYLVSDSTTLFSNKVSVSNNYDVSIGYTIRSSNANVLICDADGNENEYYYNINKSATLSNEFYLKLNVPVGDESVTTEIYLELDDGTIIKAGVILFSKDETEEIPSTDETVSDTSGSSSFEYFSSWANHYNGSITVKNEGTSTLSNFTIFVKFKDGYSLQSDQCWGPSGYTTYFDTTNNIMKIQSNYQWGTQGDVVLAPGESHEFTGIMVNILNANGNTDIVDSISIVEGLVANA